MFLAMGRCGLGCLLWWVWMWRDILGSSVCVCVCVCVCVIIYENVCVSECLPVDVFSLRTPMCMAGCVLGFKLGVRVCFPPSRLMPVEFSPFAWPAGISPSFQPAQAELRSAPLSPVCPRPSLSLHPGAGFRPQLSTHPSRWPGCQGQYSSKRSWAYIKVKDSFFFNLW